MKDNEEVESQTQWMGGNKILTFIDITRWGWKGRWIGWNNIIMPSNLQQV